jgi:hypothetical protein
VAAVLARVLLLRVHPIPKAWDWVFTRGLRRQYLARITLTDGTIIGAGWGQDSFASSYPQEEDLYLEVVYTLGEDGSFGDPRPLSAGVLLKRSEIRSIELFHGAREVTSEQSAGRRPAGE